MAVLALVDSALGQSPQPLPVWEYRALDTRDLLIHPQLSDGVVNEMKNMGITAAKSLESEFDKLGAESWELVSYADHIAVFKRLKK